MLKERRQVRWPSSAATTARVEHSVVNQLVEALRRTDREYLAAACVTVQLVLGEVLHEPGALLRHAYFSPGGFISLLSTTDQHTPLELGLNGDDGCWHASAQSPPGRTAWRWFEDPRSAATFLVKRVHDSRPVRAP